MSGAVEDNESMDEIDILPQRGSPGESRSASSPSGVTYSMSIRDYQCLSGPSVKFNLKSTNRIMGNRTRSPSEQDRDKKRKQALTEIYDLISEQGSDGPSEPGPSKRVCHYKGQDISYIKRSKG